MPTNKPRVIVTIEEVLLALIDDYWYNNRLRSRSNAITELVKKGLDFEEKNKKYWMEFFKHGKEQNIY